MSILDKYPIIKVRLIGVPKIPYADGVGKHRGVCAHATANYGSGEKEDTAIGERNYEQNTWKSAFVHYFADYSMILDVADDDYISYGCGNGNPFFINVELCQTKRADRFIESYNRWIFIMAKVLFDNKLGVIDGVTLVSHRWISENLGGSHQDPHAYIESHGKVWADVVTDVTSVYAEMEGGDEDNMAMKLEEWQWDMLYQVMGKAYNVDQLTWDWMQKIVDRTLTATELAFLNTVLDGRIDRKINV